jgi:hypothetical protein
MTAQEHMRRLTRIERCGQGLTLLCVVPLLLAFIAARQQDFDRAWSCLLVLALLYLINRLLLYRARAHLEVIGEKYKELFTR